MIDEGILRSIDYRARPAVQLLHRFDGVETGALCAGHIQSGGRFECATRYVPGLVKHGHRYVVDEATGQVNNFPEHYELDGIPVDPDDLKRGFFGRYDELLISPEANIHDWTHTQLQFTGSHLIFSQYSPGGSFGKSLDESIKRLLDAYQAPVGLNYGLNVYGEFYVDIPSVEFEYPRIKRQAEIMPFNGSKKEFSDLAVQETLQIQETVDELWKRLEMICREILETG
ncbi:hypothetical protein HYX09_04660 [Candidatus Woesearchaeota archaeon]|nr:hypothetical protein [Candidatus Woesearchaeota archaeon]